MSASTITGTSYFGKNRSQVDWAVIDRDFMSHYQQNFVTHIEAFKGGDAKFYQIRAMYNYETKISLTFHNYEHYLRIRNKIFK